METTLLGGHIEDCFLSCDHDHRGLIVSRGRNILDLTASCTLVTLESPHMFGGILCGRPPCEALRCSNSIAVTKKVNLPKILCIIDRKKTHGMDSHNTQV